MFHQLSTAAPGPLLGCQRRPDESRVAFYPLSLPKRESLLYLHMYVYYIHGGKAVALLETFINLLLFYRTEGASGIIINCFFFGISIP